MILTIAHITRRTRGLWTKASIAICLKALPITEISKERIGGIWVALNTILVNARYVCGAGNICNIKKIARPTTPPRINPQKSGVLNNLIR